MLQNNPKMIGRESLFFCGCLLNRSVSKGFKAKQRRFSWVQACSDLRAVPGAVFGVGVRVCAAVEDLWRSYVGSVWAGSFDIEGIVFINTHIFT